MKVEIYLAKSAGFCYGVKRAIKLAENSRQEEARPVYSYGPLIHNPQEVSRLLDQGIFPLSSEQDKKEKAGHKDSLLVIRSHGIGPETQARLKEDHRLVDATCPNVKAAQVKCQTYAQAGYRILIVGDKDHPEVKGMLEWSGPGAQALLSLEELDRPLEKDQLVFILSQTTQDERVFKAVVKAAKSQVTDLAVENTICKATSVRQSEARDLSERCDIMIVIGGKKSANTNKLFSIIRETKTPVYHIEEASQLKMKWFAGKDKIGVTAGASTPDWIIKEVVVAMEELKNEKVEETSTNEEAAKPEEAQASEVASTETADPAPQEVVEEVAGEAEEAPEEAEEKPNEELTMADIFTPSSDETYKVGDILNAVVVQKGDDEVLVDIGAKREGVVAARELENFEELQTGDEIELMLVKKSNREGAPVLSKKAIARRKYELEKKRQKRELAKKFDELFQAKEENHEYQVTVTEEVKGGVVVDLEGLRGFVPASHLEIGYVNDLSKYVGENLRARIIELDKRKNRIVLSQKDILAEERAVLREETWGKLEEGLTVEGKVVRTARFGAFVDLGGIDGLLHISEMGWNKVAKPEDVVEIGQVIEVKILSIDRDSEKIALSLKALQEDPWVTAMENHPEGSEVEGKVLRVTDFGAFVEIVPGFEGLLHISELAHERVEKVEDVVNPGDVVKVKIIKVNKDEKKIGLSIKATLPKPASSHKPRAKRKSAPRSERKEFHYTTEEETPLTLGDVFGDLLDLRKEKEEEENKEEVKEEAVEVEVEAKAEETVEADPATDQADEAQEQAEDKEEKTEEEKTEEEKTE